MTARSHTKNRRKQARRLRLLLARRNQRLATEAERKKTAR